VSTPTENFCTGVTNADKPNRETHIHETKSLPKPRASRLPIGLKYGASFLPGGVRTMINFARLSPDERVRHVAQRWRALYCAGREQTDLEDLCHDAGVRDCEFLGHVVRTAFELDVDVSPLIGGISQMPDAVTALFASAQRSFAAREHLSRHSRSWAGA
jgi:hypothetical protein